MAKLPHGERALIPMEKLTDYCLNPDHARGKDKARVFAAVLGITSHTSLRPGACMPLDQLSAVGFIVMHAIVWLFSAHRKVIPWKTIPLFLIMTAAHTFSHG